MATGAARAVPPDGTWVARSYRAWERPSRMRVSVVHNRSAGRGILSRNALVRAVESAGHEVVDDHENLVVAAGGDGTVIRAARSLLGTQTPLVIVPLGTANNLACGLGHSPHSEDDAPILDTLLETLAEPQACTVDVGVALGPWGRVFFYESAGVGLFADALDRLFTEEDKEPRRAARVLASFLEQHQPRHYQLSLDGVDVSGRYTMIEIMNVGMFGPRLRLSPKADPTDGRFDVVLVSDEETAPLHAYLHSIGASQPTGPPKLDIHRVRHVHLGLTGQRLRLDGDLRPMGDRREQRADLRVMQGALHVWIPPSALPPSRRCAPR